MDGGIMSQTKREAMEYILILCDDLKSEINKLMHKDGYQTYDNKAPDLEYTKRLIEDIDDEIDMLEYMFNNCIPEEVKTIQKLEGENAILKDMVDSLREKLNEKTAG
jgi:hypothetical protein